MKVLISGFDPFGGETVNPAMEVVKNLHGRRIGNIEICACTLPVVQRKSAHVLLRAITETDPHVVIAIGQAADRATISFERIAINIDDFRIPDNEGNQPLDVAVLEGGPAAYWSTLPLKSMLKNLLEHGIPANISNSAGTFVCNHVFYMLMHTLTQEGNSRRGGFIHIPYLPEQACRKQGAPSMSLETVTRGLELAVETAVLTATDSKFSAGTIC
jgi:pyroglutamyl-peptidase